jgi:thymidylate synthase (FAD)
MFKTIHDCGLGLVSYSVGTNMPDVDCLDDMMPVRAARASFGKQDKTGTNQEADIKLMKFLADEGHTSCFEHQSATFLIEVPLFIRSQIHRHRTFSYNEISRRYTAENLEFWVPDTFRGQSKSNKQCSNDEIVEHVKLHPASNSLEDVFHAYSRNAELALNFYESLVASGVAREQARAVLPQSLLTRFYMTGNLRNWQHFIELRRDGHAQYEVQVVANRIADSLRSLWPESCKALGI